MTGIAKSDSDASTPQSVSEGVELQKKTLKFSASRQVRIWRALGSLEEELGPKIASIYEGIVIALNGNNPEKISIVSHLARELSSILPRYVTGLPIPQAKATEEEIKSNLVAILKMLGRGNQSDKKIKKIIENLLSQIPEEHHRDQLKKVIDSHPLLASRPAYLNNEFIKQWMRVHRYFVINSHHHELRNKRVSSSSEADLSSNWNTFEVLMYRVLVNEPFFDVMQEIDKLLNLKKPTERSADELMQHLVEPQHRRYFFDKCSNPNWLTLLHKRGAFSSPQEVLKKDGYVQFLPWPESKYLARVAHKKAKEVYEIIKELNSDNQTVLYDFLQAALQSPSSIATRYAETIVKKKWLRGPYNLRLPDEVADLMEKLAREGKGKHSLMLASELFRLRVEKPLNENGGGSPFLPRPDAKPYFDVWQFAEIIKNKTQELSRIQPVKLFEIYAEKLEAAIKIEKREGKVNDFYEYSHIWRPNLLKARNKREDAKNILLDGLIDLIESYQNNSLKMKGFASVIRKRPYPLFRRIEMLIYKQNPDIFLKEAEKILRSKKIIIAYNLRREYLPLLETTYDRLSKEAKTDILKAIEKGPGFKKPKGYTEEQFKRIRADWKARYLAPIKNHLPKKQASEYQKIISKYGDPVDDDGEVVIWDAGRSPISSEDLSKLSGKDVLQYLADYKPPTDTFSRHSSGGLGMVFAGLVAESPGEYIPLTKSFFQKKIRPIYFYHLIHGLGEALKKEKGFDWSPVIDLCHRIVVKNDCAAKPASNEEQDLKSVRHAIADFLGASLGRNNYEIPIGLQNKIWEIISNLAEDPDPTPEYERKDGEGGLDPMTLAINTTRGEAMHAVINYGLWLARNLSDKAGGVKMPERMQALLDKHLDTKQDPSLAIRSVYGWRTPNLFYLNLPWLQANKRKIFDKESPSYLLAAWEGYLANNVIKEVFETLKEEYYEFIPHLGRIEKKGYRAADIEQRFPQHVAVIYANGIEHIDFVDHFFDTAPAKSRAEAINFIGRVILRELGSFQDKDDVKKRLGELWDKRISLPESRIDTAELREFGWWFKISPFPPKETLDRTIKTLQLIKGLIDVPYEIAENLQFYIADFPVESIAILDLIVRAERETYEHLYKKDEYVKVISSVKATGNKEAIKIADSLIHYLGSIGLIEDFRDLL